MARCYGYDNTRNAENEATVEKKQLSKDLYYYCKKELLTLFILIRNHMQKIF